MSSDGANPGFMNDPWKPDDICLTAVFGQDGLLIGSGDWGENGYLSIAPRKQEKLPKDYFFGHDKDQQFKEARVDGPGMLLIFSKPDDARDLGRMLLNLVELMEKVAEESQGMKETSRDDAVTKGPLVDSGETAQVGAGPARNHSC